MKTISKIVSVLLVALCITFPMISEARTASSYSERPTLSVIGDSISSYITQDTSWNTYYGTYGSHNCYEMPEDNMWWYQYADNTGYDLDVINGVGGSGVATPDNDASSFNNNGRYQILGKKKSPDGSAIYGGINDASNPDVTSGLFHIRYNQLIKRIHNYYDDVRLILIAPYACVLFNEVQLEKVDSFAKTIQQIAKDYDDYFVDLRGNLDYATDMCDVFLLHPNESGMNKISSAVEDTMGKTGIADIRVQLDYDHYIIKVNAYDPDYDNLLFKFSLRDNSTGEKIYDTDWQQDNCFILDEVDPNATYVAYAEIDNNNDGNAEATREKEFNNLVVKRQGEAVYNGIDYSAVYDFNTYVESYDDIYILFRNDPNKALEHFVGYGMMEQRQASENFDVTSYKNQYADLREAFGWDDYPAYYYHYLFSGQAEGRDGTGCDTLQNPVHTFFSTDYSPVYDYNYYLDNNPDLRIAFGENDVLLFGHYLNYGLYEGRQASPNFNLWTYISNYEDLRNAYGWDLAAYVLHYINYGQYEGRIAV